VILSLLLVDSLFSTLHFFKAFPMLYVYKHEYTKMERLTPLSHYLSIYILVFLPVPQSVRSILSVFPSPSISPMSKVSFIGLFSNVISNLREFVGLFHRSLQRVSFFMYFSGMSDSVFSKDALLSHIRERKRTGIPLNPCLVGRRVVPTAR